MGSAVVKPLARRRGRRKVENANDVNGVSRQEISMGNGNVNDNKVDLKIQNKNNFKPCLFSDDEAMGCFSFRSSRPIKFSKSQRKEPSICEKSSLQEEESLYCNPKKTLESKIHQNSPISNQSAELILPEIKTNKANEKQNQSRSNSRTSEVPNILPDIGLVSKHTQRSLNNIHKSTENSPSTSNMALFSKPVTSQSFSGLNDIQDDINNVNNPFYESTENIKETEKCDEVLNTITPSTRNLKQYCMDRRKAIVKDIYEEAKLFSLEDSNGLHMTNKGSTNGSNQSEKLIIDSNGRLSLRERVSTPFSDNQKNDSTSDTYQDLRGSNHSLVGPQNNDSVAPEEPQENLLQKEPCNSTSNSDSVTLVKGIDLPSEDETTHKTEISPRKQADDKEGNELKSRFSSLQIRPLNDQPNPLPGRLAPITFPSRPGHELKPLHSDAEEMPKITAPVLGAGDNADTVVLMDNAPCKKDRGDGFSSLSDQLESKKDSTMTETSDPEVSQSQEADTEVDEAIEEAAQEALSKNNPALPQLTSPQTSTADIISSKPPLPFLKESTSLAERRVQSAGCTRSKLHSPHCLLPNFSKEDIKKMTFEEGLKPSTTDGGVSFFVPVSDQGLKPKTSGINIADRITKPPRPQLSHEEKMMMANINRQLQISKKKKFALKDIANVKEALSATSSNVELNRPDRTRNKCKVNDEDDELDREFGL